MRMRAVLLLWLLATDTLLAPNRAWTFLEGMQANGLTGGQTGPRETRRLRGAARRTAVVRCSPCDITALHLLCRANFRQQTINEI